MRHLTLAVCLFFSIASAARAQDAGAVDAGAVDAGPGLDAGAPSADAGLDAGLPPGDAGLDAGLPPEDAGFDAGLPSEDAGVPPEDAGLPPVDAGIDAGLPPEDAGLPPEDAGLPPEDAGTPPEDAGLPPEDAGAPPEDAGTPPEDAGTPPEDAGTPPPCDPACIDSVTVGVCNAAGELLGVPCEAGEACVEAQCVPAGTRPDGGVNPGDCQPGCIDDRFEGACSATGELVPFECDEGASCQNGTCQPSLVGEAPVGFSCGAAGPAGGLWLGLAFLGWLFHSRRRRDGADTRASTPLH